MPWLRVDHRDGSEEILTIVESSTHYYSTWLDEDSPYLVQVTQGEQFRGLYDLDGDALSVPPPHWWIPDQIPPEVREAIEDGWATALHEVTRLEH